MFITKIDKGKYMFLINFIRLKAGYLLIFSLLVMIVVSRSDISYLTQFILGLIPVFLLLVYGYFLVRQAVDEKREH